MTDLNQHEDTHTPLDEGYLLDVNEVADLLGVTRTRVSQLTSNGLLSFERRRVGVRNRLFYKRSEVIAYQKTYYGRHVAVPQHLSSTELNSDSSLPQASARGVHDIRVGASGAASPRAQILAPEMLLLETTRLAAQEQNNALMLMRIQETLNQWMSKQIVHNKTQIKSATDLTDAEKNNEKIDTLARDIQGLAHKIDQQSETLESISLTLAGVMKEIHHLAVEQRKVQPRPTEMASERNQIAPTLHTEILIHKRLHCKQRKQTTVKKRIFSR